MEAVRILAYVGNSDGVSWPMVLGPEAYVPLMDVTSQRGRLVALVRHHLESAWSGTLVRPVLVSNAVACVSHGKCRG